jgi:hypothetical protein
MIVPFSAVASSSFTPEQAESDAQEEKQRPTYCYLHQISNFFNFFEISGPDGQRGARANPKKDEDVQQGLERA